MTENNEETISGKEPEIKNNSSNVHFPEPESVRVRLQIAWQDHHHARDQSWKTLQFVILIFIALVGVDLQLENLLVTKIAGIVTILIAVSGCQITYHHRNTVQIREFNIINRLQEHLGLMSEDLVWDIDGEIEAPGPITVLDIINPFRSNTPLFLIRVYIAVSILTAIIIFYRSIEDKETLNNSGISCFM